eukprot:TRINITY_DN55967_c0_g1_i3.p1 TRINITY_DN55967_c0_g1~~TRINITY_DN55967_c0_g1_i3.p1  ORF type:complete len:290 (+),score=29.83 TRINITY_DN55967_c0_g1_i3:297-1166(+)
MKFEEVPDQAKGLAAISVAALCGSCFGVLMRLVGHYGVFGAITFRSSTQALLFIVVLLARRRLRLLDDLKNLGMSGCLAAMAMAGQNLGISCGVLMTTVSNTFFCINTAPAICVVFDLFVLKERIPRRTMVMVFTCILAVSIIFVGTWQSGGAVIGIAIAMINPLSWALFWTIQRQRAHADPVKVRHDLPIVLALAQVLLVAFSLVASAALDDDFLGLQSASLNDTLFQDVCVFVFFGAVYLPILQLLFSVAPRYIPTAQVACGKVTETTLRFLISVPLCFGRFLLFRP